MQDGLDVVTHFDAVNVVGRKPSYADIIEDTVN
ncbi:hypothetical protein GJV44_00267 [Candidatus Vallotia cooleyia]|nr:hypothetical protein GJV44_00267 [Candidatus Vallotia cooleyia]